MTRASLREYAAVQRERYRQATRAEKRQLLDEVVAVTGIHRKAAIRLLRRQPRPRATPGPGGRPRTYGPAGAATAEVRWQASGRIGAQRLHPFVPELRDRLLRYGELSRNVAIDVLDPADLAKITMRRPPRFDSYRGKRDVATPSGILDGEAIDGTVTLTDAESFVVAAEDSRGRVVVGGRPDVQLDVGSVVVVHAYDRGRLYVIPRDIGVSTIHLRMASASTSILVEAR